jgi:hypothetical protein
LVVLGSNGVDFVAVFGTPFLPSCSVARRRG